MRLTNLRLFFMLGWVMVIGKKLFFLVLVLAVVPKAGHAVNAVIQYYVPTIFGIVSGPGGALSAFEDHDSDRRCLIPIEIKIPMLRLGNTLLSWNTIITPFLEDGSFSSLNLSLGLTFFYDLRWFWNLRIFRGDDGEENETIVANNRVDPLGMSSWFTSIYPIYDRPVVAMGKTPMLSWKMAIDMGRSINFLRFIHTSFFVRTIIFWQDSTVGVVPDIGITVGFRL